MSHRGLSRRELLSSAAAGSVALFSGCISDQSGGGGGSSFPSDGQEIRLIIPYGTGGGFDTYSREIAPYLKENIDADVNVVPENVSGGSGVLATNQVYNEQPDGTTIEMFHGTSFPLQQVLGDVKYDVKDFVYFGQVAYNVKMVLSHTNGPSTWNEIVSQAESDGVLRVSTDGTGGSPHLAFSIIADELDGVEAEFVHYNGSAESMTAIERDEADYTVANYSSAIPFVGGEGDLQYVVALNNEQPASDSDVALAPDTSVPNWQTAADLVNTIRVFVLPPETSDNIASTWEDALLSSLEDSEFQQWAEENGRPLHPANGQTARERTMGTLESAQAKEDRLSELVDL